MAETAKSWEDDNGDDAPPSDGTELTAGGDGQTVSSDGVVTPGRGA
jgi:hypothetical protein